MRSHIRFAIAAAVIAAPTYLLATPSFASAEDAAAEVCPVPNVAVPRPADPSQWPAWVEQRVKDLQPNTAERKFDRIGWSRSILAAEKLSKERNRPVFLFTHDGRINTGRC